MRITNNNYIYFAIFTSQNFFKKIKTEAATKLPATKNNIFNNTSHSDEHRSIDLKWSITYVFQIYICGVR